MKWVNSEITARFPECRCLSEIIEKLERELFDQGEVICEIRVNDKALSENEEKQLGASSIEEIFSFEVMSQKTHELITQSIQSVLDWVPQVQSLAEQAAVCFRTGKDTEARKYFKEVLESCEWLTEALKLLMPEFSKISGNANFVTQWDAVERIYFDAVQEMFDAYENKDFILVGDVLEFELSSALDKWLELLRTDDTIMSLLNLK